MLNGRLWIFDGKPLVLQPWSEAVEEDQEALKKTRVWVHIWNLPIHWLTMEAGKKISKVFSAVKEVVIPNFGSRDGKHMKISAEIDLTQPIIRGTMVKMNGMIK